MCLNNFFSLSELINVPSVDGMDGSKKAGPHASLECRGCVFAPDGRHLYSIQSGKRGPCHIVKWLIDDSTYEAEAVFKISPVAVILASKAPVIKLRISETGNYLATGGSDGRITLFDAEKAKLLQSFPQHDLPVTGLAFAPKAILESSFNENCHAILVSCSADNKLSTVFIRKPSWWPLLAFLVLFLVAALYLYLVSSYEMSS